MAAVMWDRIYMTSNYEPVIFLTIQAEFTQKAAYCFKEPTVSLIPLSPTYQHGVVTAYLAISYTRDIRQQSGNIAWEHIV